MEELDLARLLLDLLIVIAAAKLAAEVAERVGLPAVLGEILAGIVVGPSVLGLVDIVGERGVSLGVLAELGVLLLLVQVGMEMDLGELGKVGRASMLVAVIGVVLPFGGGMAAGIGLGLDTDTALFVGAALTATSVGITARVFGDLRALATTEARIVLGAAVADDVLGLIILTVVVKVVSGDDVTAGLVASTFLVALAFLVLSGVVGIVAVPRLLDLTERVSRSGTTLTVVALTIVIGFAVLADAAQLAFIIGAFMAGLAIGRSRQQERIAGELNSVGGILIPVFFVLIGVHADLDAMIRPSVLVDAALLLAVAIAGKLLSAYGASRTRSDRLLIGIGMIPRGEVGLIFASIGLSQGVLDDELYGALLLVVLLTTVMAPPALRWRMRTQARVVSAADEDVSPEPADGWTALRGDELALVGRPPSSAIVTVALQAAALAHAGRPSDQLLSWFGERRDVDVTWTRKDTDALLDVLRRGSPRAIRLLDVTGVLERGVPTVAAAVARRRADPSELDPLRVLRFPTVARVDELLLENDGSLPVDRADRTRTALLAAIALDVLGVDALPPAVRRLLHELAVDDPTRVEHVLSSARLLRAAAGDVSGYDRAELLQLAAQIGSTAELELASLLARASTPDDERLDRLDLVVELVADVLAHPDLLGDDAGALADVRRQAAEALCHDEASIVRLRAAPDSYVLTHEPEELARQARLIEPLPARSAIRVAVSPDGTPDHWIVDVACRDTQGLLARLARALTTAGCDIAAATVATWPDGAAVDTFLVRSAVRPGARRLAEAMEGSLAQRLRLAPVADVDVEFDNASLPWHTVCIATGLDRPGTLAALAAAMASADVVVHSARVTSVDGRLADRFALSDRLGRKLDERALVRIRSALGGAPSRRSRLALRR